MPQRIPINLRLLLSHLTAKASSWPIFKALCEEKGITLSEDTLLRVRGDGKATLKTLDAIARALGTKA